MMRRLRKLGCDSAGTAVIELALIAPVLALMIVGIADVSIAYGRRLELEQAVQRSIEKVMQTTGDTTVAGTIKKETVCQINGTNDDNSCATGRLTAEAGRTLAPGAVDTLSNLLKALKRTMAADQLVVTAGH